MNDQHMRRFLLGEPLEELTASSRALRDATARRLTTYSRKAFVPLTQLCRDVCHYCTFAKAPRRLGKPYLTPDEVLAIALEGKAAGCKEALFTLGDKPELRYAAARHHLAVLGFESTISYLENVARRVLEETGLIPHINAGVMAPDDYARLRRVSGSMGLMLESASERLCLRGGPHFGSLDKLPSVRLESIAAAGRAAVPFTSGLLIGIGETRAERLDALFSLRDVHLRYGHIQEIIVQNFRAKPGTKMADAPEPCEDELLWTIAAARHVMGSEVGVQSPPNLNPGRTHALIDAGIDDLGGISPVTIDHVNPEAPWPQIEVLEDECATAGRPLVERLTAYPRYLVDAERWFDPAVASALSSHSDADGLARDTIWSPGLVVPAPGSPDSPLGGSPPALALSPAIDAILMRASDGKTLSENEIASLFTARGSAAHAVVEVADTLRREAVGDAVTYVVNRNINYTNICTYSCSFCAFSKTSFKTGERDRPYNLPLAMIAERTREAYARGASEVCLQGGIHPSYSGDTYLEILRAVKNAVPDMHVHAFSPLEISHGAETLGISVGDFLLRLKDAGLGSIPGTAAEILDDRIRAVLCPDKLSKAEWLAVVEAAHRIDLPTTATIMFGSVERPIHWAGHLRAIRDLQLKTGGFTEFVPLPFVHMRSPVYLKGQARKGPTWRETVLMHAVSRIVLNGAISSIQASWPKLGLDGATACLNAGVNDLGGVLMDESISRAAGASHGQEMTVTDLAAAVAAAGRPLRRRTTLYGEHAETPGGQAEPAFA